MYLRTKEAVQIATRAATPALNYSDNLLKIYAELQAAGVVTKEELQLLKAWRTDIEHYTS
jgi:hypothetical protein